MLPFLPVIFPEEPGSFYPYWVYLQISIRTWTLDHPNCCQNNLPRLNSFPASCFKKSQAKKEVTEKRHDIFQWYIVFISSSQSKKSSVKNSRFFKSELGFLKNISPYHSILSSSPMHLMPCRYDMVIRHI